MSTTRQLQIWLFIIALFFLSLWVLGDVLVPFVIGMVIAYLLDPIVEKLCRRKIGRWQMPRGTATALVLGFFIFLLALAVMLAAPLVQQQIAGLIEAIPLYTASAQKQLVPRLYDFLEHLSPADAARLQEAAGNYAGTAVKWAAGLIQDVLKSGAAIANILSVLAITPIVAFYMMRDWQKIIIKIDDLLPRRHAPTIRGLLVQMDQAIAGFLRGQSMVCLCLGAIYAIGLGVIGLDFGFVIGVTAGLLSFVPYIGTIFGMITGVSIAFFQFGTMEDIMMVLLVFGIGQILEGYVLTPRLVGESVGLNAVWVMFALMAGASLFGFVGLLLAVPVAAIIAVLIRFAISRYKSSLLYDDHSVSSAAS